MPIYVYKCTTCDQTDELICSYDYYSSMKTEVFECPVCNNKTAEFVFHPPSIKWKWSNFHGTGVSSKDMRKDKLF